MGSQRVGTEPSIRSLDHTGIKWTNFFSLVLFSYRHTALGLLCTMKYSVVLDTLDLQILNGMCKHLKNTI
jgi:hypothetical protein